MTIPPNDCQERMDDTWSDYSMQEYEPTTCPFTGTIHESLQDFLSKTEFNFIGFQKKQRKFEVTQNWTFME